MDGIIVTIPVQKTKKPTKNSLPPCAKDKLVHQACADWGWGGKPFCHSTQRRDPFSTFFVCLFFCSGLQSATMTNVIGGPSLSMAGKCMRAAVS